MNNIEIIGLIGGALTTFGFVPQVLRAYRTKSVKDISLTFNLMFLVGVLLWLAYGILSNLPAMILSNIVTIVLMLALLYAKLKYSRHGAG